MSTLYILRYNSCQKEHVFFLFFFFLDTDTLPVRILRSGTSVNYESCHNLMEHVGRLRIQKVLIKISFGIYALSRLSLLGNTLTLRMIQLFIHPLTLPTLGICLAYMGQERNELLTLVGQKPSLRVMLRLSYQDSVRQPFNSSVPRANFIGSQKICI